MLNWEHHQRGFLVNNYHPREVFPHGQPVRHMEAHTTGYWEARSHLAAHSKTWKYCPCVTGFTAMTDSRVRESCRLDWDYRWPLRPSYMRQDWILSRRLWEITHNAANVAPSCNGELRILEMPGPWDRYPLRKWRHGLEVAEERFHVLQVAELQEQGSQALWSAMRPSWSLDAPFGAAELGFSPLGFGLTLVWLSHVMPQLLSPATECLLCALLCMLEECSLIFFFLFYRG